MDSRLSQKLKYVLPLIIVIELVLLYFQTPNLFDVARMLNLMKQLSVLVVIAVGMFFIYVSGNIDMSIGGQIALIGMVMGDMIVTSGNGFFGMLVLGILLGAAFGAVNGYFVTWMPIHPFVVTFAMSFIYRGLAKTVNGGAPVYGVSEHFEWMFSSTLLGIPSPLLIAGLCLVMGVGILRKTVFGRYIYAVGDDWPVAEMAGIDTRKTQLRAYMLSGLFVGTASMMALARVGSAQPNAEAGIELTMLAAAALGGISLSGGRGQLLRFVAGILILELMGLLMINLNVPEHFRSTIKGVVLLIAIAVDKK